MVKRIHYLDYAKGIAIILVVLGHIFSGGNIKTYIYLKCTLWSRHDKKKSTL